MLKLRALAPSVLERAGEWFLHSGIQEPSGGVARYYRSDVCHNAGVSTEITGYAVSFLVYTYQRIGEAKYLDAALRASRFLTRQAWNAELGVFPFELSGSGPAAAYFFDSGIIVRGLLAAWRATGENEFLEVATRAGRGMLEHFRTAHGIAPILVLPSRQVVPFEPRWSASPGCYQLKSAMAWRDLYEITGEAAFENGYEEALNEALRGRETFLPGDPSPERVMDRLHAFLYFLEGLLPCADRPECRSVAEAGIHRVAALLGEIAPRFARSDVYAQLLRMRLFVSSPAMASAEAAAAARFQHVAGDQRFFGGFGFGVQAGAMMPFVNPVSTAFCAQALDLWDQWQAGGWAGDRRALV